MNSVNSNGEAGYAAPCPHGHEINEYVFKMYIYKSPLNYIDMVPFHQILDEIKSQPAGIVGSCELRFTASNHLHNYTGGFEEPPRDPNACMKPKALCGPVPGMQMFNGNGSNTSMSD